MFSLSRLPILTFVCSYPYRRQSNRRLLFALSSAFPKKKRVVAAVVAGLERSSWVEGSARDAKYMGEYTCLDSMREREMTHKYLCLDEERTQPRVSIQTGQASCMLETARSTCRDVCPLRACRVECRSNRVEHRVVVRSPDRTRAEVSSALALQHVCHVSLSLFFLSFLTVSLVCSSSLVYYSMCSHYKPQLYPVYSRVCSLTMGGPSSFSTINSRFTRSRISINFLCCLPLIFTNVYANNFAYHVCSDLIRS